MLETIKINEKILSLPDNEVMDALMADNSYWYKVECAVYPFSTPSLYEELDEAFEDAFYYSADELYDLFLEKQEQTYTDMYFHEKKRTNRKYMAASKFKNKLRDKRSLFLKALREEDEVNSFYSSHNILKVEPILVNTKEVYKFKSYEIEIKPFLASIPAEFAFLSEQNSLNFNSNRMRDYIEGGVLRRLFYESINDRPPYQPIFVDYLTGTALEVPKKYSILSYRPDLNETRTMSGYKKYWIDLKSVPYNAKRSFYGKQVQGFNYCSGLNLFKSRDSDYYDYTQATNRILKQILNREEKAGLKEYFETKSFWYDFDDEDYSKLNDSFENDDWFVPAHVQRDDYWNDEVLFWSKPGIESWNEETEWMSDSDYFPYDEDDWIAIEEFNESVYYSEDSDFDRNHD